MPNKCSVIGCKSNYATETERVTVFTLPKDEQKKKEWLRKIPTDLGHLKNPYVCIKHFEDSDVIRVDSILVNGVIKEYPRKLPKLKENAIPSIFLNVPKYLSSNSITPRRLIDAEDDNFRTAVRNSLLDHPKYMEQKVIRSVADVLSYFKSLQFPSKWHVSQHEEKLYISLVHVSSNPVITGYLVVHNDLSFNLFVNKYAVWKTKLPKNVKYVNSINVLEDLLLFLEKEAVKPIDLTGLESAADILKAVVHDEPKKLEFIIDQIKLLGISKNNRRYCNETMILAASLYVQSTSAYYAVYKCGSFCLPHPRNMQNIISMFSMSDSTLESSIHYLKTKIKYLKEHEVIVNILLDEIYIEPNFSFKGGRIYGSTDINPSQVAKTAQVFMISSLLSSYKDVVLISPILNLKADHLKSLITSVIMELEKIGFKVICLISDNHTVNRKAFELFSPNNILQSTVAHPADDKRLLFILFDTVHIMKCVRNNWLNNKKHNTFTFPDKLDGSVFLKAYLKNLEMLFEIEQQSFVKFGHLLSRKVLYPSNIQKQNVSLVLKLINEKNTAALKCIAKMYPNVFTDIEGTCNFLETFTTWWKIVNVRHAFEGKRFNDDYREPIRASSVKQIQFLKDMTLWLKTWRQSIHSNDGLSAQTFQALILTNDTFIQLIPYLFQNYKIDYLLLGKFQTDDLEARFGAYRQLSGCNYYISFVQVLESERKLRFKSCVLLSAKNFNVPLKTLIPLEDNTTKTVDIDEFPDVLDVEFCLEYVPKDILPALTYITGFSVRKELSKTKCAGCSFLLQLDKTVESVEGPYDLIRELDRGKLIFPSEIAVTAVCCAWYILTQLIAKHESTFLVHKYSLTLLYKLACVQVSWQALHLNEKCECNITLQTRLESIILLSSKIFMNNLIKFKNDQNHKKVCSERKVKKLNS